MKLFHHRGQWRHWWPVVVLLLVGTYACRPLMQPGLYTAHDIWHQVARFYHYHQVLAVGFWPPGWVMDLAQGFGYPLFYFSYHLPWLVGEPLLRLGMPLPEALKLVFALGMSGSGLTMYWLCWVMTKKSLPALVGAVLYLIAPYHFLALYVAAAVGTIYQFLFVPLLFLGAYQIAAKKSRSGILVLGIGLAGSLLSHLMSTVMLLPFVLVWAISWLLVSARSDWRAWGAALLQYVGAGAVTFGLVAFYVLPLVAYKPEIIADSAGGFRDLYTAHFVSFKQLLYSPWGFGPIVSNAKDGELSLQVGIAQWLGLIGVALVGGVIIGYRWRVAPWWPLAQSQVGRRLRTQLRLNQSLVPLVMVLFLFALVVFAMLSASQPLWFLANQFMTLDYPWRLLVLAVLFGSLAGSLVLSYVKARRAVVIGSVMLLGIALYTNRNYIRVNLYTTIPVADYVAAETTTNTFAEYLPRGAVEDVAKKSNQPFILENGVTASVQEQTPVLVDAQVAASRSGMVTLRHYAFPTLMVTVDGQPVRTDKSSDGLLRLPLTSGSHRIVVAVTKPLIVQIGQAITLVTLLGLAGYILVSSFRPYAKHKTETR